MTSFNITNYINVRNGELSSDEILEIIDIEKNPQIDHIEYQNNTWNIWDNLGSHFSFKKREW